MAQLYKGRIVSDKEFKELSKKKEKIIVNQSIWKEIYYIWDKDTNFELFEWIILAEKWEKYLVRTKWRVNNIESELEIDKKKIHFNNR